MLASYSRGGPTGFGITLPAEMYTNRQRPFTAQTKYARMKLVFRRPGRGSSGSIEARRRTRILRVRFVLARQQVARLVLLQFARCVTFLSCQKLKARPGITCPVIDCTPPVFMPDCFTSESLISRREALFFQQNFFLRGFTVPTISSILKKMVYFFYFIFKSSILKSCDSLRRTSAFFASVTDLPNES